MSSRAKTEEDIARVKAEIMALRERRRIAIEVSDAMPCQSVPYWAMFLFSLYACLPTVLPAVLPAVFPTVFDFHKARCRRGRLV